MDSQLLVITFCDSETNELRRRERIAGALSGKAKRFWSKDRSQEIGGICKLSLRLASAKNEKPFDMFPRMHTSSFAINLFIWCAPPNLTFAISTRNLSTEWDSSFSSTARLDAWNVKVNLIFLYLFVADVNKEILSTNGVSVRHNNAIFGGGNYSTKPNKTPRRSNKTFFYHNWMTNLHRQLPLINSCHLTVSEKCKLFSYNESLLKLMPSETNIRFINVNCAVQRWS